MGDLSDDYGNGTYEYIPGGGEETFVNTGENHTNVALTVLRLIVCSFGIIGNLLVIFVILILAEYRKTVTHWYVLQLAIADCIFLICIPFRVVEDMNNAWTFAPWLCKAKETVLFLNYYSSVLFLMVMSIDRYIAVCHGLSTKLQKLRTPFAAMIITIAVWIISLLICIPVMLYSGVMGTKPNCRCQYEFPIPFNPHQICIDEKYEPNTTAYDNCVKLQEEKGTIDQCIETKDFFEDLNTTDLGSGFYNFLGVSGQDSLLSIPSSNEEYIPLGFDLGTTVASITPAASVESDDGDVLHMQCHYHGHGSGFRGFLIFNFTVMFLLPLLVMSVCYTFIILRLSKIRKRSDSFGASSVSSTSGTGVKGGSGRRSRNKSAASQRNNRNHKRVTIMCGCLVGLFIACWLPFHAVHLAKIQGIPGETTEFCVTLAAVASLFAYINSAINPYLYNFIGTRFGRRLVTAANTVRESVKRSTSSVSGTVRYHYKKRSGEGSSQGPTVTTKIYKGRTEIRSTDALSSNVFSDESKNQEEQKVLYPEINDQDAKLSGAPPPSYDMLAQENKEFLA